MRNKRTILFTIKKYERGIVERLGKYNRFLEPGLHGQIPFIEFTRIRDVREHKMNIHPQKLTTEDKIEITVDGMIWVKPGYDEEAIKKTFYSIEDWKAAVIQLSQTILRQEFGKLSLKESLSSRGKISNNLQIKLDEITDDWGLKVTKIEIKSINPPVTPDPDSKEDTYNIQ